MSSRIPSHQLSGGLYVSGRPDTPLTRPPSLPPRAPALVYTGGDVKLSGDLGKMFEIPTTSDRPKPTKPISGSAQTRPTSGQTGLITSDRQPDPINPGGKTGYGPNSGQIGPTGLITSGRQPDQTNPDGKMVYGPAVTDLRKSNKMRVSRAGVWVVVGAVMVVAMVAAFVAVVEKKASVVAAVVAAAVGVAAGVVTWNLWWKRKGVVGYWKGYADVELRGAVDGQYVKVTGVVTCGSIPLETSFQRVPRCVYASTELYEYRGWGGKSANPKHRFFSWGCRQAEKYVADFYISDFQSGLRALVKSGYGAKVSVFVEPTTVVDITKDNRDSSPSFLCWLSDRSLSSDDRIMRLKEGYIKEGSTVSVLGIVRRHDNVLMIVPPTEPVSTRCQWFRCLFPTYSEGLILLCDESQTADVIAV